jgi:protein-histidine pros-kinase
VEEVAATLRPLAEGKGLSFIVKMPPEDVVVRTDRRALSQILLNLVNNAIKFTQKGRIAIEVRGHGDGGRQRAELSVTDTGIGIKQEDQDRLFHAFTQVDGSSSRRYEGTGLGLHLSKKLAELLQGRITFKSEYGKGSEFRLVIEETESAP